MPHRPQSWLVRLYLRFAHRCTPPVRDLVTIELQIATVQKHLRMRRRVYPRWVAAGAMSHAEADVEIAAMEAVLATLERVQAEQRELVTPGLFT